jgi:hypothetical protein
VPVVYIWHYLHLKSSFFCELRDTHTTLSFSCGPAFVVGEMTPWGKRSIKEAKILTIFFLIIAVERI